MKHLSEIAKSFRSQQNIATTTEIAGPHPTSLQSLSLPQQKIVISLPSQKTVISTEVARPHRATQWRDPRISPLPLSVLNPQRPALSRQLCGNFTTIALATLASSFFLTDLTAHAQSTATAPPAAEAQPWKQIPIPPLHAFKPAQPRRIELPNGLVIFLQEDHELPFINGSILIRGGSRDEPAAKIGLVSLYGETWRTSGTATIDGDKLDDELEAKAASLETSGGGASTSMTWSSLKGDFDTVFAAAVDLLLHPTFKEDKLQLAKQQLNTGISRRNDDAAGIARREAIKLAYGAHNPYARELEYATVDAVKLDDLKAWHDRTVVANNIIIAVSGDFDSAAMEAKLRAAFEPLPRGQRLQTAKVTFTDPKPGVYFVEKEDVNQSNVLIVGLGTERSNPDYYALSVMNEIFSGGFGSRVVQNVRTKLGLAYSVGGSYGASYDHPGVFFVEAATKSATTVAAAKALLAEIDRLKTDPPTPAELSKAKIRSSTPSSSTTTHPTRPSANRSRSPSTAIRPTPSKNTRPASKRSPPPTSPA